MEDGDRSASLHRSDAGDVPHGTPGAPSAASVAIALTTAANLGHRDNPLVGEQPNPLMAGSAAALELAAWVIRGQIDLETARTAVYETAKGYKPDRPHRGIGSMAYFHGPIYRAHQSAQERARLAAATPPASSGAAATSGRAAAKNGQSPDARAARTAAGALAAAHALSGTSPDSQPITDNGSE